MSTIYELLPPVLCHVTHVYVRMRTNYADMHDVTIDIL